jgi:hypothetical protein
MNRKTVGKRIVESLKEFNEALKRGEPLTDNFVITKVIKQDDGTYKFIRSKPKNG